MKTAIAMFAVAGLAAAATAGQTTVTLSFDQTPSFDGAGSPLNFSQLYDLNALAGGVAGASVTVLGVAWDTTVTGFDPSWISEVAFLFDDASGTNPDAFNLRTGAGSDAPGTGSFNSGGTLLLTDAGLNPLVLSDGNLFLEIFESFDDAAGVQDGEISGTVTLTIDFTPIPAPASAGLLGLAGLAAARRRR